MKTALLIAALIAATFTAHADTERYLVVAIRTATWQDASPVKRDKIKTFFRRFVVDGHGVTPQARYIHAASSNEVMVACYAVDKLKNRNGEDITDAKLADIKSRLADSQIRMRFTDDPHTLLASWGLETPEDDIPQ